MGGFGFTSHSCERSDRQFSACAERNYRFEFELNVFEFGLSKFEFGVHILELGNQVFEFGFHLFQFANKKV